MKTDYCKIGADANENAQIYRRAGQIIRDGGLVAFPTETVYGLGANALDADAAAKIYAAKGRPSDNPLIIHIARVEDAEKYCRLDGSSPIELRTGEGADEPENRPVSLAEVYHRLAERFLPGPLTIVLPKRDCIPYAVTGGLDTVAVRLPSDGRARALIEAAGVPIAAPSANRSGKPSPTRAAHVLEDLDGRIDMLIDGGDCEIGLESTIVKIDTNGLTLLRPGKITVEMLSEVFPVTVDKVVTEKLSEGEHPIAPGMKYRHYAPDTKVVLVDSSRDGFVAFVQNEAQAGGVGALVSDSDATALSDSGAKLLTFGEGAETEAHNLFAKLREVDTLGCRIVYARLPDVAGIGLAVYNRIIKAAGYEVLHIN